VLAGCRPGSIKGSNSFPGFTGSERESSTWAVGGRAGVLVTPRFLTYFDGGFTQARFDGVNYNFAFAGGGPSGLSLGAQTYNGWFIGSGFEYAFNWLPFPGLFLKTEYRYSEYGGNNGVSVPLTGSVVGIPVTGAALNSQKATQFISTELVYRFNWFGR
jgi:outer membrane immunogenic protein